MTKTEFLSHVRALYECGNRSDNEARHAMGEDWTRPQMAGEACSAMLDTMLCALAECGAITEEERTAFYDDL